MANGGYSYDSESDLEWTDGLDLEEYYVGPMDWSDWSEEEPRDSSEEESEDCPGDESEGLPEEEAGLPKSPWLGLYHGHVIERMISHTLGSWCRHREKPKIYIVTPFIDEDGLIMIRDAIGKRKIEALYTRDKDDHPLGSKMQGILAEETFVKLRVVPREIENQKHYYHCKFVAAEFPDRVEIVMTSANLTANHFGPWQIDSVHKYQVTPEAFRKEYLKKLNEHSEDYKGPRAASGGYKPEQQKKRAPYAPTRQVVCFKCDEEGHYADECPHDFHALDRQEQQRKRVPCAPTRQGVCYSCDEEGHYADECPHDFHPVDRQEQQKKRAPCAPTRQVVCFKCDEEGHYANECPHDFHPVDRQEQQTKRALYAPTRQGVCYKCGEHGHYANECPHDFHPVEQKKQQKKRVPYAPTSRQGVCYSCGEHGHYANECPHDSHSGYESD
ncbi:hypothetical protein Bbelb_044650 [Branchiostoma belcheri]|nr:hypothetical protein Bbelb_044650 [Branchiostoma belcheri]